MDKKRNGIWTVVMAVGFLLIAAAIVLTLRNFNEQNAAAKSSESVASELSELIMAAPNATVYGSKNNERAEATAPQEVYATTGVSTGEDGEPQQEEELPAVEVDGARYIGVLTISSLGLQLPVHEDWDYVKLKTAPCRYYGSPYDENFVICAHNYDRHFGQIKTLREGDEIWFTDLRGVTFIYRVSAVEVLAPTATADVVSGEWALTLFTCTLGGRTRVVVRCDLAEQ